MKTTDQIAAEVAEAILGNTADDTDKRITADIIKAAIREAYMEGYGEGVKDMTEAAKEVTRPL